MNNNWIGTRLFCLILISFISCNSFAYSQRRVVQGDWLKTMQWAMKKYGHNADARLQPYFDQAHVAFPPKQIGLLIFKKERKLEVWAEDDKKHWTYIRKYPLTGFSGHLGPKLHYHDDQMPEGIYQLNVMNPFSHYHLSMELNYPNAYDRYHASLEHRYHLGGEIFIHGSHLSVGCYPVGDIPIEDLFTLVYHVGRLHTQVIVAPNDLRKAPPATDMRKEPKWTADLYHRIAYALRKFHRA